MSLFYINIFIFYIFFIVHRFANMCLNGKFRLLSVLVNPAAAANQDSCSTDLCISLIINKIKMQKIRDIFLIYFTKINRKIWRICRKLDPQRTRLKVNMK